MLILDKIRQIKDKKIAVELAKWCAKQAAADAARVAGDSAWAAADAAMAAARVARAADAAWAAANADDAAYWAAMAADDAADAAYWATDAAYWDAARATDAAWAAMASKYEQIASKLKELTGETFYYRCIGGSKEIFEQLDDQIKIGCISETKEWWLENYEEKGKENGYSEEQIKEYGEYINANPR